MTTNVRLSWCWRINRSEKFYCCVKYLNREKFFRVMMLTFVEFVAHNFPLRNKLIFWVAPPLETVQRSLKAWRKLCGRLKVTGNHAMLFGSSTDHSMAHFIIDWLLAAIRHSHHSSWPFTFSTLCWERSCSVGIESTRQSHSHRESIWGKLRERD